MSEGKRLYRRTENRQVAGVASGLGEYLGIDPTLIRLGFALATLLGGGSGLVLYILFWVLIPEA